MIFPMLRMLPAGLLSGALLLAAPATAQDTAPGGSVLPEDAERLMGEGLAKLLGALNLLMETIPQYAAPEVLPNGDIIIRRLHPGEDGSEPRGKPEEDRHDDYDGTQT